MFHEKCTLMSKNTESKAPVTLWNLWLKLMCNSSGKQVSAGISLLYYNYMKSWKLFRNVESGLQVLFLFCTLSATLVWMLAMNHNELVILFSDWLNLQPHDSITRLGNTSFTNWWCYMVSLVFITTATIATITEVESRFTCLTMEVQKSFKKSIMLL